MPLEPIGMLPLNKDMIDFHLLETRSMSLLLLSMPGQTHGILLQEFLTNLRTSWTSSERLMYVQFTSSVYGAVLDYFFQTNTINVLSKSGRVPPSLTIFLIHSHNMSGKKTRLIQQKQFEILKETVKVLFPQCNGYSYIF